MTIYVFNAQTGYIARKIITEGIVYNTIERIREQFGLSDVQPIARPNYLCYENENYIMEVTMN